NKNNQQNKNLIITEANVLLLLEFKLNNLTILPLITSNTAYSPTNPTGITNVFFSIVSFLSTIYFKSIIFILNNLISIINCYNYMCNFYERVVILGRFNM